MKRIISIVLIFVMFASNVAFAKPGDVAGNIFSTDIVGYIDGMAIPSYNIGGKTVVIAEELISYGFDVIWNDVAREIKVYTKELPENSPSFIPQKSIVPGKITGVVYETDINAYVNDMWVESYNIGGRTALVMEDMASLDDDAKRMSRDGNPHRAIGYSVSLMRAEWNENARTISLFTIRPKSKINTPYGEFTVNSISQSDYRNGAYKFTTSDGAVVSNWNGVISYANDTYLSLSDLMESNVFGNLSALVGDNALRIATDGLREVFWQNASTSGSCLNMLVTFSEKINVNGTPSQTENADVLLYKGDVYISVNAINSSLGKNFISPR